MEIGKYKECLLKNETKHQICLKMKLTTDLKNIANMIF